MVDICCGSGTTAVAALNAGRNFIVNDKELKYANTTQERLNKIIKEI